MNQDFWIYHELQDYLLCGQHCLNNLLQGGYFTAPDLASIAEALDLQERQHMFEGGVDNPEYIKFLAEGSGNVDDSGNFSYQVLSNALQNSHDVSLVPWAKVDNSHIAHDPTQEEGYIVNRSQHWFAIRKICGIWWNLNSTIDRPEKISDFYLSAFLSQLHADGYSVFIASGKLPESAREKGLGIGGTGNWYRSSELLNPASSVHSSAASAVPVASPSPFSGPGRRLDGLDLSSSKRSSNGPPSMNHVAEDLMDEDEDYLLAEAIKNSLLDLSSSASTQILANEDKSERKNSVAARTTQENNDTTRNVKSTVGVEDEKAAKRALRLAAIEKRSK